MTDQNNKGELHGRVQGANALKDYAINNKILVPDDVIAAIDQVSDAVHKESAEKIGTHSAKLDMAIRDLTQLTYPATIETVLFQSSDIGRRRIRRLKFVVCAVGLLSLLTAMAAFTLDPLPRNKAAREKVSVESTEDTSTPTMLAQPLLSRGQVHSIAASTLAMALGVLGAALFSLYNLTGVINERALGSEDAFSEYARLVLGPIVAWVFFFSFARDAFDTGGSSLLLLLPFLAGFSTKLVMGIINKAIQAVQITLGLEDKTSELQDRKVKSRRKVPSLV